MSVSAAAPDDGTAAVASAVAAASPVPPRRAVGECDPLPPWSTMAVGVVARGRREGKDQSARHSGVLPLVTGQVCNEEVGMRENNCKRSICK